MFDGTFLLTQVKNSAFACGVEEGEGKGPVLESRGLAPVPGLPFASWEARTSLGPGASTNPHEEDGGIHLWGARKDERELTCE